MKIFKAKKITKKEIILPTNNISRQIIAEILPWLKRKEVIVLLGARQTGKTTILYQLILNYLLKKSRNVFYFNLDFPHQLDFFQTADNLIDLITKQRKFCYVIIDEVQRLKSPGLFLKSIYDLSLPVKIIVSGSSTLEIKAKIQEALTGRKIVFPVYPFNFDELTLALKQDEFNHQVFEHFLTLGSYPAVATEKDERIKKARLQEIFQSYLDRDIKAFLKVENVQAFTRLVSLLASQVGSLLNKAELSNSLGIHLNTLDNYLFYLQQTFIIDMVTPFYRNKRKEILKSPKAYFLDLGIRNLAIRNLSPYGFRQDRGELLENFCYLHLKRTVDPLVPVHFWRTKAQAEMDFVILPRLKPIPIEVKAQKLKQPRISRSFRSFLKTYQPKRGYYLNLDYNGIKKFVGTKVIFATPKDFINLKTI